MQKHADIPVAPGSCATVEPRMEVEIFHRPECTKAGAGQLADQLVRGDAMGPGSIPKAGIELEMRRGAGFFIADSTS